MMNNKLVVLLIGALSWHCTRAPEGQKVSADSSKEVAEASAAALTYTVDPAASEIKWVATEPGEAGHQGTISLLEGALQIQDSSIAAGKLILDMNSISVTDLTGGRKAKLESHLKDGDFFETNRFPRGAFEITKVTPLTGNPRATHEISGNLTLRDSTKNVTFPAKISWQGPVLVANTPQFTIDRTQWGVVYRSGIIGTLKDKLIDDQVGLTIQLTAKPR